ncbi:GNAT family N-acetyltransferase [Chryseobacterium lactis]|uniref:GNAT family N-acetyltransferase n=1 Tax=Chryseobacterium lactis TaxID=1241981 RepID=UPI0013DE6CF4|nr:GNAT family N-acetyltransferase [Chryseobacterium lactis]
MYGYCGPISNLCFKEISKEHFTLLRNFFLDFCKTNKIVSVFSRLHPIVDYGSFFSEFGEISILNKTVVINLRQSHEKQYECYRKSTKYEIRRLAKQGYTITEAHKPEEVDDFIKIYYKTMSKVNAFERYYYDKNYFYKFLNNIDYRIMLLLAKKDNKLVAGAIFTIVGDIMQYHLAATMDEYIKDSPMKLIINEARKKANSYNLKYLHLGGGFGGKDNDNLFLFKSGFSKDFRQFSIWKLIVNDTQYNKLVLIRNLHQTKNNFFPLYRL